MNNEGFNGERDGPVRQIALILVLSFIGLFALAAIL